MRPANLKQKGVALLMTLSILLVLSVALMKSLEEKATESRLQKGEERDFQATVLVRTGFITMLNALDQAGIWEVMESPVGISPMRDPESPHRYLVSLPIGAGFIRSVTIQPIDHLYDLNVGVLPSSVMRVVQFQNLMDQLADERGEAIEIYSDAAMSGLNDFLDSDGLPDDVIGLGREQHEDQPIPFQTKNAALDTLEEFRLLPEISAIHLTSRELASKFRVQPRPCQEVSLGGCSVVEQLDVNLATRLEILQFIECYQGVAGFEALVTNREQFADMLLENRKSLTKPKYETPLDQRDGTFQKELQSYGIELSTFEKGLFMAETSLVRIEIEAEYQGLRKKGQAVVQFKKGGEALSQTEIIIRSYQVD